MSAFSLRNLIKSISSTFIVRIPKKKRKIELISDLEAKRLRAKLIIRTKGTVKEVPIDRAVITIGRGNDNDIALPDHRISRHHTKIVLRDHTFFISDLGSANGTFLNSKRIKEAELSNGDIISLGYNTAKLEYRQQIYKVPEIRKSVEIVREKKPASDLKEIPAILTKTTIFNTKKVFPLTEFMTTLGRDRTNNIVSTNITVSRWHTMILYHTDRFVIYDLNSTNGTWVNDKPISWRELEDGDKIKLGDGDEYQFELKRILEEAEPGDNTVRVRPQIPSWERMIESIKIGILVSGTNNRIIVINKSAEILLELRREQLYNNYLWNFLPILASSQIMETMESFSAGERKERVLTLNINNRDLKWEFFPFSDRRGYLGSIIMIGEKKEGESDSSPEENHREMLSSKETVERLTDLIIQQFDANLTTRQRDFLRGFMVIEISRIYKDLRWRFLNELIRPQ